MEVLFYNNSKQEWGKLLLPQEKLIIRQLYFLNKLTRVQMLIPFNKWNCELSKYKVKRTMHFQWIIELEDYSKIFSQCFNCTIYRVRYFVCLLWKQMNEYLFFHLKSVFSYKKSFQTFCDTLFDGKLNGFEKPTNLFHLSDNIIRSRWTNHAKEKKNNHFAVF